MRSASLAPAYFFAALRLIDTLALPAVLRFSDMLALRASTFSFALARR